MRQPRILPERTTKKSRLKTNPGNTTDSAAKTAAAAAAAAKTATKTAVTASIAAAKVTDAAAAAAVKVAAVAKTTIATAAAPTSDAVIKAAIAAADATNKAAIAAAVESAADAANKTAVSNGRYNRNLIEASPDSLIAINRKGKITDVNKATEAVTGRPRDRLIGMDFSDCFSDSDMARQGYMAAFSEGLVRDIPLTIKHKSGRLIDVLYSASVYKDENAIVQGVFAVARDITERKQAENALRASQHDLQIFLNYAYDCEYLVKTDGSIVNMSPSCERITGYSATEFREKPELLLEIVHPDDRHFVGDHLKGIASLDNECSLEFRIITKSGQVRWIAHVCRVVFDYEDQMLGRRVCNRDISGRKYAEDEEAKALEKLKETLDGTVNVILAISSMRDPYTSGHALRVTQLALAIAHELGYNKSRLANLRIAAELHDIGKVAVPAEILNKPGRLTDTEMSMIKVHAQYSYDILKQSELDNEVVMTVWQHHERNDGSGYPNGLQKADICHGAQILAVADVVEAMSSHRPYRPALGIDAALEEIQKNEGKLYTPDIVDICAELFREKAFKFEDRTVGDWRGAGS